MFNKLMLVIFAIVSSTVSFANETKMPVDTASSTVSWLGKKKIVQDKHFGKIKVKDGFVVVDKKGVPQSAQVIIDMKSITNEDLKDKSYNAKLVGHLSSADFFDVNKFPESVLTVKSFAKDKVNKKDDAKNATLYKATGELKIKDVVQPISFDVQILPVDGVYKGKGKVVINRTLWGVKYGSDSFFKGLGDKVIADDMELDFDLITKK